jgi:uncharacterized protein (UPF0261 family)
MLNFGPSDTVPAKFADRLAYKHNPTITLTRTTLEENAELGKRPPQKLNQARGPVALFIPLHGVSLIAKEGQVFYDPEFDAALLREIRENLDPGVEVREMDTDINDPAFAVAMADARLAHYQAGLLPYAAPIPFASWMSSYRNCARWVFPACRIS